MYFELKVFELGEKMKIQLDTNLPFGNDTNSIIDAPGLNAKRTREILFFVANEIIPRVVAKHNKSYLKEAVENFKKDEKGSLAEIIKFIETETADPAKITGFNFEELSPEKLYSTSSTIVNGDMPPPKKR